MNRFYKILALWCFSLLGHTNLQAQCSGVTITPSKATYCAGEAITVSINNPSTGVKYRDIINGVTYLDTIAIVSLPGATTTKDYYIDVQFMNILNQWTSCQPIVQLRPKITISPSPDPTLTEANNFKICDQGTTPQQIVVTNASSTTAINTNYIINWGDGSANYSSSTFNSSVSHTYATGLYILTYTVIGNGSLGACNTATRTYTVSIGSSPRIDATFFNNLVCAPTDYTFSVNLDSMSINLSNTTYSLIINNQVVQNYTQSNLTPTISTYFQEGSCDKDCNGRKQYSVLLRAKNDCGITDAQTCVPVKDSIDPYIQGKDTVCLNDPTTYIDGNLKDKVFNSDPTANCLPVPRNWTVTPNTNYNSSNSNLNNAIYNTNDLNITFTDTGHFRIKLSEQGDCNDKDVFKNIVVVEKVKALATFTSPPCIPASGFIDVPISNLSTKRPSARGYTWTITPNTGTSFVSGSATSDSVTVRFTKSGSYTVKLTVDGACDDATWDSILVIKGKPVIDTSTIPEACFFPATINPANYFTFNNGGDPNAIYSWTFTGGNPATSNSATPGAVNYTTSGVFPIVLHIQNICGGSTLTNTFTVNNNPKPSAGNDTGICINTASFTLVGSPIGGTWSGQSINATSGLFDPAGLLAGNYTMVYTVNPLSPCPMRDTLIIKISKLDSISLAPQTVCKSTRAVILAGSSTYPNGNWSGPGVVNSTTGLFDPVGLVPGVHDVFYTYQDSTHACTKTAIKKVTVLDSVWIGTPPVLCVDQSFDFGTISGNIQTATWKFGDGTPNAIIPRPTHIYTSVGNFIVTLYAETQDRCKDTILIPIKVIDNPPLSFITSNYDSCTGSLVTFSFPASHDTATHYAWSFGVSTLEENLPNTHIINFPAPINGDSTYIITLRADYYCGSEYFSDTIKVKSKPKADFQVQPIGCSPFKPTILNQSYGSPTSYIWNFGNGTTSTLQNPVVPTYINNTPRDTTYTIKLKVSNTCGTDSISKTFVLKGNNVNADFFTSINNGCRPLSVDFYSISTPGVQLIWDFGDGQQGFAEEITHTYDTAGTFKVKLLAIGSCGRDSAFATVVVYPKPVANFTVKNPCVGRTTQFINGSTNGNSYIWDFGDGSPLSSLQNPTHVYNTVGGYVVKLIVSNANGCKDSIINTIGVYTQPQAGFTVQDNDLCETQPTILINQSQNANNYVWYFGNGETSTDAAPNYTYPNPGTFTISLVAINGACRDSFYRPAAVQIHPKPIADFIYELTSNGFKDPVIFTNTTANANSYIWLFGDGDSSIVTDPTHQYGGTGPYRVTLYAVSSFGCKDTVSKALGVDYSGTLYTPNVFAPEIGIGEGGIFKPKALALKEYHLQIFSTYGQLLWESTALIDGQPAEGWDGRFKGTLMPQDVYVWKIRAIFESGKAWEGMADPKTGKKSIMGSVLLLR